MVNLRNCINSGDFFKLKNYAEHMSLQVRHTELVTAACDIDSLAVYIAACFFILDQQNVETHHVASVIMAAALTHYKGAYSCGLFHARFMIQLDSKDYTNFEWILFFYAIPENLVTRQEAYTYAQKILSIDSHHKLALDTKNEIENKWLHNIVESKTYIPHDEEHAEFVTLVHTGFYEQAKELLKNYTYEEVFALLFTLMQRHQSVAFYTYAFFMLLDQETVQGHLLAGQLLMQLTEVTGAQSGALFHARRMLELEPQSLKSLEFFLSFYVLPEPLLTAEEARECAQKIIAIDSRHADANALLKTV